MTIHPMRPPRRPKPPKPNQVQIDRTDHGIELTVDRTPAEVVPFTGNTTGNRRPALSEKS